MSDDKWSPRIIEKKCGGCLAISDHADPLQIGVAAASEDEARKAFEAARQRWQALLDTDTAAIAAFAPPIYL